MTYPFKDNLPFVQPGIVARILTWYETRRITARERRDTIHLDMHQLNGARSLASDDIPLVFVTHNDMNMLPMVLAHYRELGVTRFICVDDVSKDGTRDYLLAQPDVDVWASSLRFAEARRGRRWREQLFRHYGLNRWYLNIDSDELLVYDNYEQQPLSKLIQMLEQSGQKRLAAPMLDMYPARDIETVDQNHPVSVPWSYASHFDGSGYEISADKRGVSIMGGPRGRRFGEKNELIKYPVIYWDEQCYFGSSLHRPLPYNRNFVTVWGAILHFKFHVDYIDKIAEATTEQQHYAGSVHYKKMKEEIDSKGSIDLYDDISIAFEDSRQLVDLGFISSINWER